MKHKILCDICNREFETEEEEKIFDIVLCRYVSEMETICPNCREDRDLID